MDELREIYNKIKDQSQPRVISQEPTIAIVEHFKNLAEARQKTHTGQEATAKSMLKASNKKQMSIKINDLVLLYVDSVDRGKSAPNNLLCYVVEQKHDKFKLACSVGI